MNKLSKIYGISSSRIASNHTGSLTGTLPPYGGQARGSLERFKRGRKPGMLIEGIFLRLEPASPGTAWVNLEGETLLAALPDDLSEIARLNLSSKGVGAKSSTETRPFPLAEGAACVFFLEKVEPEPVLRMLGPGTAARLTPESQSRLKAALSNQAGQRLKDLCNLPLSILATRYKSNRDQLAALLKNSAPTRFKEDSFEKNGSEASNQLMSNQGNWLENRSTYLSLLCSSYNMLESYTEYNLFRTALVLTLKPFGLRDLRFSPWLCPKAYMVELAILDREKSVRIFNSLPAKLNEEGACFALQLSLNTEQGSTWYGQTHAPEKARRIPWKAGQNDLLTQLLSLDDRQFGGGFSLRA